jgi:pimeloyl-ACP methyl ester carboxylesterase
MPLNLGRSGLPGPDPGGDRRPAPVLSATVPVEEYDEFGMFHENAEEFGLPFDGPPVVRRVSIDVAPGRQVSALKWGTAPPEVVLLHGGAQNAHTWDTVALALDRPLLAVDLPGHGHSDGGTHGPGSVQHHARDVAVAVRELAPDAAAVAGMSLGGMTALALAANEPGLVRRLVLVDITPGVDAEKAAPIIAFVSGPPTFASFEEILARTKEFNPTRSEASLRRGILHNAVQQDDGTWVWRYARHRESPTVGPPEFGDLWEAVSALTMPVLLARGMAPGSVVSDEDEAEFLRRQPGARVARVEGAGHSIQGDRPVELAGLIADFIG